jgi:hypothetical protein
MKAEAIQALQLFKQMHMAQPEPIEVTTQESKPKKQKGVNFNYPDHYKPLKDRIMSALNNGARTADTIAKYCKENNVKLVNLQLGRWVSRGMIGKQTNPQSGITRYYPHDEAKEKGILQKPAPINRKKKAQDRSSSYDEFGVNTGNSFNTPPKSNQKDVDYIAFLENRMTQWQQEARKQAQQILELQDLLSQAIAKANAPRNVTGEVEEVMREVMDLRATVAYLESKLFGGK